jgi:hypothetical protein
VEAQKWEWGRGIDGTETRAMGKKERVEHKVGDTKEVPEEVNTEDQGDGRDS